jgi:hypothetical protein
MTEDIDWSLLNAFVASCVKHCRPLRIEQFNKDMNEIERRMRMALLAIGRQHPSFENLKVANR